MSAAAAGQDHGEPAGQVAARGEGAGLEGGLWRGQARRVERGQGLSPASLLGALHVCVLLPGLQESRDPHPAQVPGNIKES